MVEKRVTSPLLVRLQCSIIIEYHFLHAACTWRSQVPTLCLYLSHGFCSFLGAFKHREDCRGGHPHRRGHERPSQRDARTLIEHARVETQVQKPFPMDSHAILPTPLRDHLHRMPCDV